MNNRDELLALKESIALLITDNSEQNKEMVTKRLEDMEFSERNKPYGLFFEDYEEEVVEELKGRLLIPTQKDDKTIMKDENKKTNMLLEGDNYQALKQLLKTHKEKIDVIYIDPPYNTGNKDFVYNDAYVNNEDAYRHSKWLSFMHKRLELAKKLMSSDGVIFISIDENEQAQLRLLCDQVFGEQNFVNTITLKAKASSGASGGGEDKRLKKNTEYVLFYAKNYNNLSYTKPTNKMEISELITKYKEDKKGFYYTRVLMDTGKKTLIKDLDGMQIYKHSEYKFTTIANIMLEENLTLSEAYAKYFDKIFMVTNAQTSLLTKVNNVYPEKGDLISYTYIPKSGKYKDTFTTKYVWNKTLVVWFKDSALKIGNTVYKNQNIGTLWDDISWGRLDLQGGVEFNNGKKPLGLLKRIISMFKPDATVLDFFAGSGTTGHAVMELNKEDGGNRQFILATNNEVSPDKELQLLIFKGLVPQTPEVKKGQPFKDWKQSISEFKETIAYEDFLQSEDYAELGIARQVTYERLKRVINGYTTPKGKVIEGIPNNLKYIKLDVLEKSKVVYGEYQRDLMKDLVFFNEGLTEIKESEFYLGVTPEKEVYYSSDEEELESLINHIKENPSEKDVYIYTNILLSNQFSHLEDGFTFKQFPDF